MNKNRARYRHLLIKKPRHQRSTKKDLIGRFGSFLYWYGGLGAIHWMVKLDRNEGRKKPSAIVLWIIGIYSALYGVVAQRYELALGRLYTTFNAYVTRLEFADEALLNGFVSLQSDHVPVEPSFNPIDVYRSIWYKAHDPKIRKDVSAQANLAIKELLERESQIYLKGYVFDEIRLGSRKKRSKIDLKNSQGTYLFVENAELRLSGAIPTHVGFDNSEIEIYQDATVQDKEPQGSASLIGDADLIFFPQGIFMDGHSLFGQITEDLVYLKDCNDCMFLETHIRMNGSSKVRNAVFINSTIEVTGQDFFKENIFLNCDFPDSTGFRGNITKAAFIDSLFQEDRARLLDKEQLVNYLNEEMTAYQYIDLMKRQMRK